MKIKTLFGIAVLAAGMMAVSCNNQGVKPAPEETSSATAAEESSVDRFATKTEKTEIELDEISSSVFEEEEVEDSTVDMTVAVDDYVWRELSIAHEYYSQGVIANRETNWEEAQYYFEKALKILGNLDIDTELDEQTPETAKYSVLLADIVTNYRVTLLSLGHLPGDVSPDVLMTRFSEINNIKIDTAEFNKLEQYAEAEITYDVPIVLNERVKNCILYYQTVARDAVERYLSRSTKYIPMIDSIFEEMDMPADIKYLALVESGYNPHAYSWARALGLWQFIASTGKLYDLDRSWWYDERKDPIKATVSAARFLKDLYNEFGSWELAMAGYNGGPARVRRQIRRQGTRDFWKLDLKKQTEDYVPFFMAAVLISKNPEKFGFKNINYQPAWEYDLVTIDKCLDLKTVAAAIGCSVSEVKELNPELLRRFTPPNRKNYELRIPKGTSSQFLAAYDSMPSSKETSFVRHRIRRGEAVSTIARKYGVSQYAIFEANNLHRRSKIYAGKTLIVPVPNDRNYSRSQKLDYEAKGNVYVVRSGDTVWDIARAFGTSTDNIRRWNKLDRRSRIYVGQNLIVSNNPKHASKTISTSNSDDGDSNLYVVRKGDSLWEIARMFGTSTAALRNLNGLGRSSRIYPGQKLLVPGSGDLGSYKIHTVRRGDTLSDIARLYGISVQKLIAWNGVSNPRALRVGEKLKIYTN